MEGQITKANKQDLQEIIYLQRQAFQKIAIQEDNFYITPLTQTLEDIEIEFERRLFLKYTINDKIVGSVRAHLQDNVCHIGRLVVLPEFQNKGIGKRLLQEIENLFANCEKFVLFTGLKHGALGFYIKFGYTVTSMEEFNGIPIACLEKKNIKQLNVQS